VHSINILVKF